MQLGEIVSGKYRLLRLLGDGGMGAVFEAHHEVLGSKVAIKVLHEDLARKPELVDRFLREARVLAQIANPHVVRVLDVAMGDGAHPAYIVMELLGGEPLSALLGRERKLPLPVAVGYANQVLEALAAAHALGVVHRDLKPENIFVTREGDRTVLKVIDFGIAKAAGALAGATANLTIAGALMGTPEYMAPEQAHSADRADARSDIYAVGVLLYEMISGARPVDGEDPRAVATKVERGEIHPLIHRSPEVPRELAGLVHRAMAPRPELRFASAAEMRATLEAALGARPSSVSPPPVAAGPAAPNRVSAPPPNVEPVRAQATGTLFGSEAEGAPRTDPAGAEAPPAQQWQPEPAAAPALQGPPPRAGVGRRRGGGGTMWLLIGLGVLTLAGVAVALLFPRSSTTAVATRASATAAVDTSSAAALPSTAPTTEVLDPSLPSLPVTPVAVTRTIVNPPPHGGPASSGSSGGAASGVPSVVPGVISPPFGMPPFTFPAGIPSNLPNPFPNGAASGVGPVITIPTSFPGFGFPPSPAAPAPPPAPPASSPPHHGNH
jgi:serine/threonine-protein kinase